MDIETDGSIEVINVWRVRHVKLATIKVVSLEKKNHENLMGL